MVAKKKTNDRIVYRGQEYHLAFNLNVMQTIQEEYGSLDEWGKKTEGKDGEPDAKAVIFGFAAMINEGIDIDNEDNGTDVKPLTLKQVGRLIGAVGIDAINAQMQSIVVASTQTEDGSKNA